LCRRKLVADWEESVKPSGEVTVGEATLNYQALQDVMKSDRFKVARSLCQPEIELYNRAAAIVCSLESSEVKKHDLTYTEAWGGSAQFMDGEYDLATMFVYTDNFRDVGATSTCLVDCQIGGDGCKELEMWLPHFGDTSAEQYCSLKWYGIDNAYGDLKICAAKAIGESSLSTKDEYANAFTVSHLSQLNCAYDYCHGESDMEEVTVAADCAQSPGLGNSCSADNSCPHGESGQVCCNGTCLCPDMCTEKNRSSTNDEPVSSSTSSTVSPGSSSSANGHGHQRAQQYCEQPDPILYPEGCRLEYNGRVFNKDGGACQGRCYCQHIHERFRTRYGGRTYACSSPHLDDLPEENEDSGDVVY